MKSTKRLTTLLTAFSPFLLAFSSCSTVERPDADACLQNVPGVRQLCHNLKTDYDDIGNLLPGIPAKVIQHKDEAEMLAALNKNICFSPDGWAAIKAWLKDLRDNDGRSGD